VAKAWANYYGQFINRLEGEGKQSVPLDILTLLAQLVICTALVTQTENDVIGPFFKQVRPSGYTCTFVRS
jgi:hypothetical protein